MKCEACQKDIDGSFGTGRFCNRKCAASFSTRARREEITQKVKDTFRLKVNAKKRVSDVSRLEMHQAAMNATCWTKFFKLLKINPSIVAKQELVETTRQLEIDISHFKRRRTIDQWLSIRPNESKGHLREILLATGRKLECELCGLGPTWNGQALTLQVDHINGIKFDHRKENLRFLCPNCHSQTDTFTWKNVK